MTRLFIFIFFFSSAHSYAKLCNKDDNYFAKYDRKASNGNCVKTVTPSDTADIDNIFAQHDIKVTYDKVKKNKNELHAAAEVIQAISHVSGGQFNMHNGFIFNLHNPYTRDDGRRVTWSTCINNNSKQTSTLMLNSSGCQSRAVLNQERAAVDTGRNNATHIAHEMAHCFGWKSLPARSGSLYSQYQKAVGDSCKVTHYCNKNGNENFAEVFSLFLLNPDRLQESPGCRKGLQFFCRSIF